MASSISITFLQTTPVLVRTNYVLFLCVALYLANIQVMPGAEALASLAVTTNRSNGNANSFCGDPGNIRHGHRQPDVKSGTIFPYGAQLHFSCGAGYKLTHGASKMVCGYDGEWQPPTKPRCLPVRCPRPSIPHGHIMVSGPEFAPKTSLEVRCDDGYRLRNKFVSLVECKLDGTWTGHNGAFTLELPECVEFTCPPLLQVDNSILVYDGDRGYDGGFQEGTVAKYTCQERFQILSGQRLGGSAQDIRCQNGTWVGNTNPSCKLMGCNPPPAILNGDVRILSTGSVIQSDLDYPVGVRVIYWCDVGYALMGSSATYTCMASGLWSPRRPPNCQSTREGEIRVRCPKPPVVRFGYVTDEQDKYFASSRVTYACHPGFQLKASEQLVCDTSGNWQPLDRSLTPWCQIEDNKLFEWGSVDGTFVGSTSPPATVSMLDTMGAQTQTLVTALCATGILFLVLVVVLISQKRHYRSRYLGLRLPMDGPSAPVGPPPCHDLDRVALIAIADRIHAAGLPTYEETVAQGNCPPFEAISSHGPSGTHFPTGRHGRCATMQQTLHNAGYGAFTHHSGCGRSSSLADSLGSTDTVTPSEVSTTVTVDTLSSAASQATSSTTSTRGFCGSLASFDMAGSGSICNIQGVPLLEEEAETERMLSLGQDEDGNTSEL